MKDLLNAVMYLLIGVLLLKWVNYVPADQVAANNKAAKREVLEYGASGLTKEDVLNQQHEYVDNAKKQQFGKAISLSNDLVSIEVDVSSGAILKADLSQYYSAVDAKTPQNLLNSQNGDYILPKVAIADGSYVKFTSHKRFESDNKSGVILTGAAKDRVFELKIYVKPNSYEVFVDVEKVQGQGEYKFDLQRFKSEEVTKGFLPGVYKGASFSLPGTKTYKKIALNEAAKKDFNAKASNGWAAYQDAYFLTALVPQFNDEVTYYNIGLSKGLVVGYEATASGKLSNSVYIGPEKRELLENVAKNLELTIDYGFLHYVCLLLFYIMSSLYEFLQSWGLSIICLTVIIRLILLPTTILRFKNEAKLKKIQPQIDAINAKYKNDVYAAQPEIFKVQSQAGYNALAQGGLTLLSILGALPMIGLYWVLLESIELRHSGFLWISDLGVYDGFFILPVLMALTGFIQARLNASSSAVKSEFQNVMQYAPLIISVLLIFMPSGFVVYSVTSNIFSILETKIFKR